LELSKQFKYIRILGNGPYENYCDRNFSAQIGLYEYEIEHNMVSNIKPQESGNHTKVRWVEVMDKDNDALIIQAQNEIEFSSSLYNHMEIEYAKHIHELPLSNKTMIYINYKQMGVGGIDSWGSLPLDEYLIKPNKKYSYTFYLDVKK